MAEPSAASHLRPRARAWPSLAPTPSPSGSRNAPARSKGRGRCIRPNGNPQGRNFPNGRERTRRFFARPSPDRLSVPCFTLTSRRVGRTHHRDGHDWPREDGGPCPPDMTLGIEKKAHAEPRRRRLGSWAWVWEGPMSPGRRRGAPIGRDQSISSLFIGSCRYIDGSLLPWGVKTLAQTVPLIVLVMKWTEPSHITTLMPPKWPLLG
jgi:hypothetical protein